jgi:hypothetical protein
MRTQLLALLAALASAPASAQVIQVQLPLPTIRFEAPPPLVVVTPGVQVVPDYDEEVFFADGWYWYTRDSRWYRARDHRGGWVFVEPRVVPRSVVVLPRGKYKRWKAAMKEERREERREERHDHDDDDHGGKGKGHGKHKH